MERMFVAREAWVLSGSMVSWGDSIVAQCDGVVFLTLEPDERLRWLAHLDLPVLRLDSAQTREELRDKVLAWSPRG